jgi:DNA-binding CsgD family transcriptional regulator
MFSLLEQLEVDLSKANSLQECDAALAAYLLQKKLTTYSFTYYAYHPNSSNKLKYDMCSDNFKSWHRHYLEAQYSQIDSTLEHVYNHHLPIYWNLQQQLLQASSEQELEMRRDSIAFGSESGLSIPIHGPHNDFAILLLVNMKVDELDLENALVQYELFVAAHYYYHHIQTHLLDEVSDEKAFGITQREIQCLILIHKQYSVKKMAQHLELTERTINYHIQKINKKLGTKNKYQSLAKALELKLLTL